MSKYFDGYATFSYSEMPKGNTNFNYNLESMFQAYSKILEEKDKQLAELEAQNEKLKENNTSHLVKLFDDENKKLKQQLKEKDEEIESQKEKIQYLFDKNGEQLKLWNECASDKMKLEAQLRNNTHQVCEKIREKFSDSRSHNWGIPQLELYELLDQIERGEEC